MGAQPSPAGTERLRPRSSPGTGWSRGVARGWAGGLAGWRAGSGQAVVGSSSRPRGEGLGPQACWLGVKLGLLVEGTACRPRAGCWKVCGVLEDMCAAHLS